MSGQPQMQSFAHERQALGTPMLERIGLLLGGGALAALASSLPVSFRAETSGFGWLERWLVLSATTTPLAIAAVAIFQRAQLGLRMLVGERRAPLALAALWWSVIQLGLLSVFGALLRKTTHHHALAGVTFAMFAVVTGIGVALFAGRTTALLVRSGVKSERRGLLLAVGCAGLSVVIVGLRTSSAEELHTTAAIADGFALIVTTLAASSRVGQKWKALPKIGVPLAVTVLLVGLLILRFDSSLSKALADSSPIFALVSGIFGG
jgi:hypothetical protein